jgi:sodium-dependent dicarboxylate transporter 2/3/5
MPRPWLIAGLALAAAVFGWLLAPEEWAPGPASLELRYRGQMAIETGVEAGAGTPLVLTGEAGSVDLSIQMAEGVPVDETVVATVRIEEAGRSFRPELNDLEIELVFADGERARVPILRWDPVDEVLEAARRPPVDTAVVLGLLGLVVVLWISEAIPLFVTSLVIPLVLVLTDVAPAREALAPFFHPIIALFFGGFLMAEAMKRVGLDHFVAVAIVAKAGRSPVALFGAMIGVAAFLSMWMSNTAATAVLTPIALAVTAPMRHPGYRKAVVLGIAYAATIGGVGSAIGTPANPLAIEFLDTFAGHEIAFVEWFPYGLPMVILFLPIMAVYLWRRSRATVRPDVFTEVRRVAAKELERLGRPTRDQMIVLAVFAGVMSTWLTQTWHGLDTGIVALGGAVALAVLGKVVPEDLGRISWEALLTFGGGLTLGVFLVETGTSDWLAGKMAVLAGAPDLLALGAVAALALAMTTVASNTATAAMLIPLAIPLAGMIGLDPVLVVVVVAIASSVDFALVIGTPPTMIAYSTKLYTTREIFSTGIVLDLAGIALLVTAVAGLWNLVGIV